MSVLYRTCSIVLIAVFALSCLALPAVAGVLDEFMTSCWAKPSSDATVRAFVAAGFNTVSGDATNLELCRKHGLKVIYRADTPEEARALADDLAILGWWVRDEPKEEQFAEVGAEVAALHEADPTRFAYVNLMAWMNLDNYLEVVKPRVLSYDYYQWWWGDANHFWRLEAHRNAALKAGIPLICWVEGTSDRRWEWGEKGQSYLPDNMPKLRQSVYTSLAYGVRGIQWFNDYIIFEHASGRRLLPRLRKAGRDVRQLNRELQALGPTLMRLQSTGVYHTEPLPKATHPAPEDCWAQPQGNNLVLGLFDGDDGARYAMLVNRKVTGRQWAALQLPPTTTTVQSLCRETGRWQDVALSRNGEHAAVTFILEPGDGRLLKVR